jgi:hypothetical protein
MDELRGSGSPNDVFPASRLNCLPLMMVLTGKTALLESFTEIQHWTKISREHSSDVMKRKKFLNKDNMKWSFSSSWRMCRL